MSANLTNLVRIGDAGKPPPVCRCLFGRPNRENLEHALSVQENLLTQENDDAKRFQERWGFDPITGKPVSGGRYECKPVDKSDLPSFYSKGYPRRKTKPCSRSMRERSRSPISPCRLLIGFISNDSNSGSLVRPSAKRRLPLEDEYNDENKQDPALTEVENRMNAGSCSRVTVEAVNTNNSVPTPASSVESSPKSDSYPSPLSLQELELRTPQQQTHQTSVKDFFPMHKRQRVSSPKQSCPT